MSPTPKNTKIKTIPWQRALSEIATAATPRYLPSSSPRAKKPKAKNAIAKAIEKENSPAIVDAILPP